MTAKKLKMFSVAKLSDYYLSIGQGAIDLIINLIAMIMVERSLNQAGLGIFSFILSIYFTIGYLSEFGVPGFLERAVALTGNGKTRTEATMRALAAIRLSGLTTAGLFIVTAFKDTSITRIEESAIIYVIIGLSIPFRNINRLKLSMLQGTGLHSLVSKLRTKKRLFYLGCIIFLLITGVRPSMLVIALILPEILQTIQLRREIKLPGVFKTGLQLKTAIATLKKSKDFLLTENAFDIILYLDFLILGIFISSNQLGIYSEASIIARIFLLIPVSIKPVIRNMYCNIVAKNEYNTFGLTANRISTLIFFINALIALYLLLFFQNIMNLFFITHGEELISFKIFTIILPGLLFYATAITKEPVYEALDRQKSLQSLAILIFIVNLFLNIYLVPFAGISGAASATMLSTFLFFIINEKKLNGITGTSFYSWFTAGVWIYVFYTVCQYTTNYPVLTFLFLPPALFICFFLSGFFDYRAAN